MMDKSDEFPELELPERISEAASWAACDALHDILSAHPDEQAYVLGQYLEAFANRSSKVTNGDRK